MNPWGLMILALGVIILIIAWHGSQHSVVSALKAKPKS